MWTHVQLCARVMCIWIYIFIVFYSFIFSADLMVTLARPSDTGLYSCEVTNNQGVDMASSFVTVRGN